MHWVVAVSVKNLLQWAGIARPCASQMWLGMQVLRKGDALFNCLISKSTESYWFLTNGDDSIGMLFFEIFQKKNSRLKCERLRKPSRWSVYITWAPFALSVNYFWLSRHDTQQKRYLIPLFRSARRYSSRGSGLNQSDSLLSGGSVGQLTPGGGIYLPDYSVRQLTDLQIIKVMNRNV